jgi:hypothetical protein
MNSLQELNTWGSTPVDFLDARSSKVIFNRQSPLTAENQTFDAYAGLFVIPTPGIEIVEIINYQTANVRYRVSILTGSSPTFTGSTITFGTFNSGVTLSQSGDVYTVSGIHSVSDWNSVKNFTWTLPVDFASYPQWFLECTIIYYDSALGQDVETTWDIIDDRFYNVAALSSESSITAIIGVKSPASAALTSVVSVYANLWNQVVGAAAISSEAIFACEGNVNVTFLNATSIMNINAGKTARITDNLAAVASMSIAAIASLVNLDPRSYLANQGNAIFATNTPQVDSLNSADTFSIVLSSSLGYFAANSTDAPTSTLTISGLKSVVNSAFTNVYFYPTKGSSASGTLSWAQSRNGTLEFTKTVSLTGTANAFPEVTTYYTTVGTTTFTPTRSQVYYGLVDILIVGGGGGGARGGGGGGGTVNEYFNLSLTAGAKSIVVGAGGARGDTSTTWPTHPSQAAWSFHGSNGASSSALGYTSTGGIGGRSSGGASGSSSNFSGGNSEFSGGAPIASFSTSVNYQWYYFGGGGGGAGGGGTSALYYALGNGGIGQLSTITNQYYGGGGGGGEGSTLFSGDVSSGGFGGNGGGGNGGWHVDSSQGIITSTTQGTPGTPNTGGGGGGGGRFGSEGFPAAGGSGIVIIKIHA